MKKLITKIHWYLLVLFAVKTRWCVFTGAPSSGKTSTLEALEKLGYKWTPEVARRFIDEELSKGFTIEVIRKDEAVFQRNLVMTKLKIESEELKPDDLVFMDRAMPDSITYYKVAGLNPKEVLGLSKRFRYHRVFVFDRLPLEEDGVRVENEETANFLDRQLEADYRALGYDVIRVPVMTIDQRVQFILEKIN